MKHQECECKVVKSFGW